MKQQQDEPRLEVVPDHIDFAAEERKILQKWRDKNTFQTSLDRNRGKPHYTFYDGPPFATGLPHYGHILAGLIDLKFAQKSSQFIGTIKDIVTRWAHQSGFYVERRFGWDTHGLPVEYEVDKILGVKGPSDVLDMGIGVYNAKCRGIVMRYAEEWQHMVERTGRWIDFDNDYKTLYPWFMESVWWVFSQLFKKNFVYRGVKVMPFSTGCSTPLSNFEAGQNYQDVVDPSVFVAFPLVENSKRSFVAWTTTPWTLPSNLALCVNPNLVYAVILDVKTQKEYIMLKERLSELYKSANLYKIIETIKGSELAGKEYIPPFPYFLNLKEAGRKVFVVITNTYVKTDQGTGIVHQSPYFGEEDHKTCLEHGIITKDAEMTCPVNEKGIFTDEVVDFKGLYVKDADKQIIKMLKEKGLLLKQEQYKHSYPFCYRSHTPLIYKAVPSWFIRVESLVEQLLLNNEKTRWVPSFVRDKRFANWLRDARDWAVSRNRFWGTPINLWVSEDHTEIVCPGSIAELEELTGTKITDLHRENIDDLTIPSKVKGNGPLKRVSEVFDCWFESGSMPYAQQHYPFENSEVFENNFPADFIAEGFFYFSFTTPVVLLTKIRLENAHTFSDAIRLENRFPDNKTLLFILRLNNISEGDSIDQTRGWFYTLLVISTALFNRPPFKNLICNGLVLASDGNKMSKSKKNYPDPMEIVEKYGADALRLYLINSPVVRGENLRFQEEGVAEVVKQVLGPWLNAYKFVSLAINKYEAESGNQFVLYKKGFTNLMDQWILSFTNSLEIFYQ
uniref:isoleucine--tRNA ligase n=1 Tax=Meloidogyne incognita TaxID=6306 RepID=A0A914LTU7_MELIC